MRSIEKCNPDRRLRNPVGSRFRALVATVATCAALHSASAALVVDQSYMPAQLDSASSLCNICSPMAQTFLAGTSGQLMAVDLLLSMDPILNRAPLQVEIRTTTNGTPVSNVIASVLFDSSRIGYSYPVTSANFVRVEFGQGAPMIAAGDTYAIVLYRLDFDGNSVGWYGSSMGEYGNGQAFSAEFDRASHPPGAPHTDPELFRDPKWFKMLPGGDRSLDMGFRTYIDDGSAALPEPGGFSITALAIGLMAASRWRRRPTTTATTLTQGALKLRYRCSE